MEDFYIGGALVKLFLPIFKMNFPGRQNHIHARCRWLGQRSPNTGRCRDE